MESSLRGIRELSSRKGKDFRLTHVTLCVAQEGKLGSWEGDLVSIRISRHVVYTRASAGGFLSSFLKLHFQVVLDLQKGWEKAL